MPLFSHLQNMARIDLYSTVAQLRRVFYGNKREFLSVF